MERKCLKHFRQKQHCAVVVLALSSSVVNSESWGKVFMETWRECHIVVSRHHTIKEISMNIISLKYGSINEKVQEFRGLSALLIGIKEERPGKHLRLTFAFSIETQIPHWVNVPSKHPALRTKKQSAKIKPLNSHRPYRTWTKINFLCYREWNTMSTALRNKIWPNQPPTQCLLHG